MFRSRLIFAILFLAYLGVTPAGVYTCACLMPPQPTLYQVDLDEISQQSSVLNTAVATLLNFFSLTFMVAVIFWLVGRWKYFRQGLPSWLEPYRFCEPPPTPPPHFT